MKQVVRRLSTYSADLFGISSALYELGGLVVMHDASGCNSTYNTHDEPRWYTMDSMLYISALRENDVILGNDQKLIDDICEVANVRKPAFIAISASLIPLFMATDMTGIARVIEKRTGIPSFGFKTNAIDSYIVGANMAFEAILDRFCHDEKTLFSSSCGEQNDATKIKINLLGVTPLDFSIVGNVEALKDIFEDNGYDINCCLAMGDSLQTISRAGEADVNLIVSSSGESAAKLLHEKYGTPYVTGIPIGSSATKALLNSIDKAFAQKMNISPFGSSDKTEIDEVQGNESPKLHESKTVIIGEPVFSSSLRKCLECDFNIKGVQIICPTEVMMDLLRDCDLQAAEEETIEEAISKAKTVIADPIYRRIIDSDSNTVFVNFPHEAYSGRMYRSHIPIFIGDSIESWLRERIDRQEEIDVNDIQIVNRKGIEQWKKQE